MSTLSAGEVLIAPIHPQQSLFDALKYLVGLPSCAFGKKVHDRHAVFEDAYQQLVGIRASTGCSCCLEERSFRPPFVGVRGGSFVELHQEADRFPPHASKRITRDGRALAEHNTFVAARNSVQFRTESLPQHF